MNRRVASRGKAHRYAYRLVIRYQGKRDQHYLTSDKKALRRVRDKHLANGAEVEEQVQTEHFTYRTKWIHQPGGAAISEATR